jgi:hypothetical protein
VPGLLVAERHGGLIITRGVSATEARAIQRQCKAGELARLAPGIYVRDLDPQAQALRVREHWVRILGELVPGSVVSYRSAYGAVAAEGLLVLSHPTRFNRTIRLPGLRVALVKGPGPLPGDTPLGDGALHLASMERMLLENLTRPRGAEGRSRGEEAVRQRLAQILASHGSEALDRLCKRAGELTAALEMAPQLIRLKTLVGDVRAEQAQPQPIAEPEPEVVLEPPPDPACVSMLEELASRLRQRRWPSVAAPSGREDRGRLNEAFIEAWFDCFESGDLRAIAQARIAILEAEVVVAGSVPMRELLSAYKLAASSPLCDSVPPFGKWFAQGLQARHALLMHLAEPAVAGQLRGAVPSQDAPEAAVAPGQIEPTLAAGSTIALGVPEGLARAIYYLVTLWRVRPFERANDRLAHLLMNAELSSVGEARIMVPARLRGQLALSRERLLRDDDPGRVIRLLRRLQRWSGSLDYSDLDALLARLAAMRAFEPRVRA